MEGVRYDWQIESPACYLAAVVLCAIAIRLFHCTLAAYKRTHELGWSRQVYAKQFKRFFVGIHPAGTGSSSDYGFTLILGVFELIAYPILIATGAWVAVGTWVGLKALAQWKVWESDRAVFNLFLIGNASNVLVAAFILVRFVSLPTKGGV
jgi:hypothetical protein